MMTYLVIRGFFWHLIKVPISDGHSTASVVDTLNRSKEMYKTKKKKKSYFTLFSFLLSLVYFILNLASLLLFVVAICFREVSMLPVL